MFVYCALNTANVRVEFFIVLCLKQLVVELISQCCFSACVFSRDYGVSVFLKWICSLL